ncbi:hypothetical protein SAMN05444280_1439 [Tangfeifania diversioriginum]|uniref:Uncharacterized protein n=1 Tax=Tangfeifania diversioriginum TaxID=1168035 RepID=A0A1M6NKE5_9BACT|nr:hypothetical protein [Tangfeifania diversioriginum]SHJ96002.1 hypothetical protein SAMN05444280_1439 [Tangfeifania diversioriginum]
MENKPFNSFLKEIAELIDQKEDVRLQEMKKLIDKWKVLIECFHQPGRSQAEEYREWCHLKLSVEWIKETVIIEKKSLPQIC